MKTVPWRPSSRYFHLDSATSVNVLFRNERVLSAQQETAATRLQGMSFAGSSVCCLSERFKGRKKVLAEAFDLFNHPNFQQGSINNVQFTTA
jgi:hypothetical protein